jgi:hypothetical protein
MTNSGTMIIKNGLKWYGDGKHFLLQEKEQTKNLMVPCQ